MGKPHDGKDVAVAKAIENGEATSKFGLIRVVTTLNHFENVSGRTPRIGDWFEFKLAPKGSPTTRRPRIGIPTWYAGLTGSGYTTYSTGHTTSIDFLVDDEADGPLPSSLGAAVVLTKRLPSSISNACSLTSIANQSSPSTVLRQLSGSRPASDIVVFDVGQASFNQVRDASGKAIFFYDVGLPISFNRHTAPPELAFHMSEGAPVVLSHWDWDHLHAALRFPALLERPWVVPRQKLGPGAARLAHILAAKNNLHVWTSGHAQTSFGILSSCSGPYGDQNNSGLAVQVNLRRGRTALLVGDADYSAARIGGRSLNPDYLVATHHGALFSGGVVSVPRPSAIGDTYVLSFGAGNVYRHPHDVALDLHKRAGWRHELSTAARHGSPRGDVILRS